MPADVERDSPEYPNELEQATGVEQAIPVLGDLAGLDPWEASCEEEELAGHQPLTQHLSAQLVEGSADEEYETDDEYEEHEVDVESTNAEVVGDQIFSRLFDNLHLPYAPAFSSLGAPSRTVLQECYFKGRLKQLKKISDEALDLDLKRNAQNLDGISGGHFYPRSFHLLKKLLGVTKSYEVERHVCVKEDYLFPQTISGDPKNEACPKCGELRFKAVGKSQKVIYKPRKVFWYFGLDSVLRQFFMDKEWCKLRRAGILNSQVNLHDYRASPEFMRLQSKTGNCLSDSDNGLYDIGFDFGQVFQFKSHSSGFLGIRWATTPFIQTQSSTHLIIQHFLGALILSFCCNSSFWLTWIATS